MPLGMFASIARLRKHCLRLHAKIGPLYSCESDTLDLKT